MTVLAIVQARMGSTRLHGKVLEDICGQTILARVIERVSGARHVDSVLVATTTRQRDEVIVRESERLGVAVFRGSEDDVLGRYHDAAQQSDATIIVRVTADCPFLDPSLVDAVVAALEAEGADYASNTLKRTFPRGLDVEAMTRDTLLRCWREATAEYERAHVTPFIYEHPEQFRLAGVSTDEDWSGVRLTVDTSEDLTLAREVCALLPAGSIVAWRDLVDVVQRHPWLLEVNRHVAQKPLREG